MKRTIIALLLVAVLAFACAPNEIRTTGTYTPVSTFDPDTDVRPTNFKSQEEYESFLSGVGPSTYGGVGFERFAVRGVAAPMAAMDSKAESDDGGSSNGFSTTNNQVANVDEADIIKTDGEYIYTTSGTTLFIISAGDGAEVIATIELEQQPSGLFIEGDQLVVFGNFYDIDYFKEIDFVPRRGGMTFFNVYDISDPEDPELLKEFKFEGAYFQARMHEGTVYFVVTVFPEGGSEYPTPVIINGAEVRSMPVTDIYYFPVPYSEVQLATVHAVDLGNLDVDSVSSRAVAVEWNNQLYMSESNIYITHTEQINEWEIRQSIIMELLEPQLTQEDRVLIDRIEGTDDDILSRNEKQQKIYAVYASYYEYMGSERTDFEKQVDERLKAELEQYEAMSYTIINRISIESLEVAATGKVPGSLNNQFAMDEHEGHLRVATTIDPWWGWARPMPVEPFVGVAEPAVAIDAPAPDMPQSGSGTAPAQAVDPAGNVAPAIEVDADMAREIEARKMAVLPTERSQSTNNVYVLDMGMDVVGELTDLAAGERIFSTRFMGDRLYMVTFRQVDPFFAIDLSDPTDPTVLGELKIPGFSRYLHPYDENTIIGIGRDATELGQQQGLKVSLFDVTNPAKPVELAKWVADEQYSQSAAEYEHKAFLFDREKELLVIPAYSYNWDTRGGRQQYNGAMVFRINPDEIEMRGIIDHSRGAGPESSWYGPAVERSLWIDDLLYTKSPNLLRVNALDDLSGVANVTLTSKGTSPYPIY